MDEQVVAAVEQQSEAAGDIEAFVARYPFPLDDFQLEAIAQLAQDRSVMVAAPTGTGKTLVAEYAIWRAQQRHQRVIYTTPLKALSNQKYRDMRALYGTDAVGLVTGDIVEHSTASIVIMTTEVYRNILLEEGGDRFGRGENIIPSSMADVGSIIFDELHYLSDIGRGPVWEEAIICSPLNVQLVGLSATVSKAEDLADWISRVHRPMSLVVHEERAVPLKHYYFIDKTLHLVPDADGNRIERFPDVGGEARMASLMQGNRTFTFDGDEEETDEWEDDQWAKKNKKRRSATKETAVGEVSISSSTSVGEEEEQISKPRRHVERRAPEPGEVLTALRDADLLPCLYFLPGRKVVEEGAASAALHIFTTPEEEALIKEEVGVWLENMPKEDRNLQQVHALAEILPRGLAFHHAGLLPGLKVLVETLFARGHLSAVFATDTLALGINMPARAVVVGSLSKFDGQEMRLLIPNEYRQLTGRAGRRGMDVRGAAVIPYSPWEPFEESFQRITGELLPVTSSFVIRYNSVLNLWRPGDTRHLYRICASSLREYQRYQLWEERELVRLELWRIEQRVHGIEERAGLTYSPGIIADFHGVALSWSRGMSLTGLLKRIDLAEGDLLMSLNQTIDLLQQVQAAVGQVLDAHDIWEHALPVLTDGVSDDSSIKNRTRQLQAHHERMARLRPLFAQASSSLLRGIVIQSRTIPSMAATAALDEASLDKPAATELP